MRTGGWKKFHPLFFLACPDQFPTPFPNDGEFSDHCMQNRANSYSVPAITHGKALRRPQSPSLSPAQPGDPRPGSECCRCSALQCRVAPTSSSRRIQAAGGDSFLSGCRNRPPLRTGRDPFHESAPSPSKPLMRNPGRRTVPTCGRFHSRFTGRSCQGMAASGGPAASKIPAPCSCR